MAEVSQNIKYVKLDDGVSFSLVRTNPKLTTNTKLMYNGKKMYMESYAYSELMNRTTYKNVSIKQNSTYNKDIANFLMGSGSQAYSVYQNFSNVAISDSYDNQYETMYWCGAEYIDSSFYTEEIGFVAPLYLREKLPNYFLIFRLDTPSNYNFTLDEKGKTKDASFNFKTDILDKAVLIKTFDLREGSILGNYIHNYVNQEGFEYDKSMCVNFTNAEVTYYGINRVNGVFEKRVESFKNELLKNDCPLLTEEKWFTEGFERNNLIFPYIMNIEYLFDDDNFKEGDGESYDFARYIGVYCNNIELGEIVGVDGLMEDGYKLDNAIYYFEDINGDMHRYTYDAYGLKIDGKSSESFDNKLISGYEKERVTGYAEPLDMYDGFINRAQYGFEILKPFEPGDWVGIEYNGHVECYFADNKNFNGGDKEDSLIGSYSDFRFAVSEKSGVNSVAEALVKCVNRNKKSKFEAKCADNVVALYAKREGKEYNGSENGGAKILIEASLIYNRKISLPISNSIKYVSGDNVPIEDISDSDLVNSALILGDNDEVIGYAESSFGDYYKDYFCGACNVDINAKQGTYKNVFKIYADEYVIFDVNRYLKTNNGEGRRICANMVYIDETGKVDSKFRLILVDDAPVDKKGDNGWDISVSSTYQVEIMDPLKVKHGIFSWFPLKDFDFDINYSSYGQYGAFVDECDRLSRKITYTHLYNLIDTADSDSMSTKETAIYGIKELAQAPFIDGFGNSLDTEYDYYLETIHPDLCLISKSVPYIAKWGYYDEQKDSCENPYRLNVSKIFGVSNLSANTYLRDANVNEYTHSMPYYMTLVKPNYYKEYQYIGSDEIYSIHYKEDKTEQPSLGDISVDDYFNTFYDCVDYWVNKVFMRTDKDMFSQFFSGKKYGNRFDRKYSRLLNGDKFNNPSTLFRGVKFEAVRQFNGADKRSSEYNDYKFSFVYIPVMVKSMVFNSTVHFVKNDKFKFIVGIVFVNTMLGTYDHNIFGGNIDYFNKGFLYAASKDKIRPENSNSYRHTLTISYVEDGKTKSIENIYNDVWKNNFDVNKERNEFYMWFDFNNQTIIVTKSRDITKEFEVIGEYDLEYGADASDGKGIEKITAPKLRQYKLLIALDKEDEYQISYGRYYELFDAIIYRETTIKYYGSILCEVGSPNINLMNNVFTEICDADWVYYDEKYSCGYKVDVSKLHFKADSIKNILVNIDEVNCIESINIYNVDSPVEGGRGINKRYENGKNGIGISVDTANGDITISSSASLFATRIEMPGHNRESIENLRIDIVIRDKFDINLESVGLKGYFSVFNQLSMYNLTENINSDYNVNYYSTVEDNKYKIRVIEPDCIEINDIYEAIPVKITQNNKIAVGSVEIKEKMDVDKIGVNVINRYSGYYNPIFNDILYYDDYTYTKSVGRLKNEVKFEMPYSNTHINYRYNDNYGEFGVIRNMCYHKTNVSHSDRILTLENPIYPAINEYALDYRSYNIFSSSWDEGYFVSQDDLNTRSLCTGIGSMKDGLCMFGSKYMNLPDNIFVDTFENGKLWDEKMATDVRDNTDVEIMYKEINDKTVRYQLFIEKRLKRYLKESLIDVFSKYINKKYSFGNKGTIEDDVEEYIEKNLLRLYAVDKVYLYIKDEKVGINDKLIENEYLKYVNLSNELKIKNGFLVVENGGKTTLKDNNFTMGKVNEFDRLVTYNLKSGHKEGFGFGVKFKRK